jgi:hypothetical protein
LSHKQDCASRIKMKTKSDSDWTTQNAVCNTICLDLV